MRILGRLGRILRDAFDGIAQMEDLDLIPRLTLAILILYAGAYWYIHVPMTVVCIGGLVFRSLYRNRWYWLLLSAVMAWGNFLNWYDVDNHKFLMTYWCLAVYCSLSLSEPSAALAKNARLLIGLCFAMATVWKVLAPDYLSGGFFHFTLLSDPRFQHLAEIGGGLPASSSTWNRTILGQYHSFDGSIDVGILRSTPAVAALAKWMTWWTILLEAVVAVLFLAPGQRLADRSRNLFLLVFAVTTYAIAHVVGYGWVLMVMGAAQCSTAERRFRVAYVVVFFLIQIYTAPWTMMLQGLGGQG